MKTIKIILAITVLAAFTVAGCGNNRGTAANVGAEQATAPKKMDKRDIKVMPPVALNVIYDANSGATAVPVKVEVVPAENAEEIQVGWNLPENVKMVSGETKKKLTGANLAKGAKTELNVSLRGDGAPSDPAVVTVKVLMNGQWFGAAKAVQIGPKKPGPQYKISPDGYIEMPMIKN